MQLALQAELLKGFQAPAENQQQPPAGADPTDPTGAGGGTIGIGQAPVPGEQGFSANGQGTTQQVEAAGEQQAVAPLQ